MGTQGSYINHLDLQQYLKDNEGYKVKFYCENVKRLFEVMKESRRSYYFKPGEVKVLRKEIVEPEVVVTDFKTLITARELGIWIICNKLLIMDTIELTYHLKDMKNARFYYDVDIYDSLRNFYTKETIFLMPPCNKKIFEKKYPDLDSRIFFKSINIDMLNTINFRRRDGYFYRWDDSKDYSKLVEEEMGAPGHKYEPEWKLKKGMKIPLKYNEPDHIFDYHLLVYRRRKYLEYQEQFGRLIFEYILLGKKVYFIGDIYTDDGLTDYLRHYEIEFEDNGIVTTKEELQEKMNYKYKPWED